MMIQTEHRGYRIHYSENEERWSCLDVGASDTSLAAVKRKIDRVALAHRKANAVECFEVDLDGGLTEGVITEYLGIKRTRWSSDGDVPEVAVVAKRRGSDRPTRRNEKLNSLAPATPEVIEAARRAAEALQAVKAAQAAHKAAVAAIPRLTEADVAQLAKVAEGATDEP